MYEDDHEEENLQTDAVTAEKVTINEAYRSLHLAELMTTGKTQTQNTTTDAPLQDESVIAVRDKVLDVSGEKVSAGQAQHDAQHDEQPQHDDQSVQQDRWSSVCANSVTSCAFDARDQGLHRQGCAREDAEEYHAD